MRRRQAYAQQVEQVGGHATPAVIVRITPESHTCGKCLRTFKNTHGLKVHAARCAG